jgi:hypothetical protein
VATQTITAPLKLPIFGTPLPMATLSGAGASSPVQYLNRAWDTSVGRHVLWVTSGAEDISTGASYPGPGTFDPAQGGADTQSHVVQVIL